MMLAVQIHLRSHRMIFRQNQRKQKKRNMKNYLGKSIAILFILQMTSDVIYGDTTTCADRCMESHYSSMSCHCDASCGQFSNCCDDFIALCLNNAQNSCYGRCFSSSEFVDSPNCYCDDKCSEFNNCCEDYVNECANINSCENRCMVSYNASLPCHCDSICVSYDNCCADYDEYCGGSCQGICLSDYDPDRPCQCNDVCENYHNCCGDFSDLCVNTVGYLCNGECNVTRNGCNCTDTCNEDGICCTDYEQSCNGATKWVDDECTKEEDMVCPQGFDLAPVILFSLDGFRDDYLFREKTPNLWKLATCGVHSPYLRSVYPTKTFPNHYSIATGLYPESHGIIDNKMYDHEHKEEFTLGSESSFHSFWWKGEPIWNTVSNQGLKSACYFWPGSDVNITRYPDYYYKYDGSVPNEERMLQALKWLDLPADERPSFITLYMDITDKAGHDGGPDGPEIDEALAETDRIIGMLMDGLKSRQLDKCVNIIMVADHGMASLSCDRETILRDYGINLDEVYFRGGAFGRIGKSKDETLWPKFDPVETKQTLQCKHNETHFQVFLKDEYFPKRYHYAKNDRIEPVSLVLDDGWLVWGKSSAYCTGGTHGFDNEYVSMHALFLAHGSSFERALNMTEPFENIQLYNLMADLLDITPAPNNGTTGSLYKIMKEDKTIQQEAYGAPESISECKYGNSNANIDYGCTSCEDGVSIEEANARLQLTDEQITQYQKDNMLRSTPRVFHPIPEEDVTYCLLTHKDYITAYNNQKRMPFYTAYVLEREPRSVSDNPSCLRGDVRLHNNKQTSCSHYNSNADVTTAFSYPPMFSNGDSRSDAQILSNAFPIYKTFEPIWDQFQKILSNWADMYNGITVVSGPVFDYDYNGHADSKDVISEQGKFVQLTKATPIPTHIFVIVTRCRNYMSGISVRDCANNAKDIDVVSFIIPNFAEQPCYPNVSDASHWVPDILFEHVARVKDIEILTALQFFTDWALSDDNDVKLAGLDIKLRLPQFRSSWLQDFLENATPRPDLFETTTTQDAHSFHINNTVLISLLLLLSITVNQLFCM